MQTRQVKSNSPGTATKAPEPAQNAVVKGGAATLVPAWASTQNNHAGLADVQKERTGEPKETTKADMPAKEQADTKKMPVDATTSATATSTAGKKEGEEAVAATAVPTQPIAANPQGDPHFQAVIGKLDKSAEKTKQHAPAKKKVAAAHAAAVPPANEKQAGAQAKQVGVMNNAEVKKPEPQSFLDLLRVKIDQIMPQKLGDTERFMKGGEKQQLKDTMTGNVNQQKQEAAGGIKSATSQAPDASQVEGKQVTPLPAETTPTPSPIDAAGAVPQPKAEGEVSLNQSKQDADQSLKQANVTPEQLQKANDPRFSAVVTAKGAVDKQADTAPQKYRADEQKTITQAAAKAVSDEKQGLGVLHGQRGKTDSSVVQGQQDAKGNDEKARQEVTNNIEKIYTETKQTVEGKLSSLETDVSAMFDKGIEGAMTHMADYINGRMAAYKAERYSGLEGAAQWLIDLVLPLPDKVNVFFSDGLKVFKDELDTLIVSIANTVETRLKEAKDEIDNGQKRISDYVKGLDKSLQTVGEAAEKEIAGRFDEMRQSVDDKKNDLADKLAQHYKEAYDKASDKVKEMQAENKSLLTVLEEKVGEVVKILTEFKERILGMLKTGKETIDLIVADPIAFLKHLLDAIKKGLHQFVDNIWTHLKAGFMAWLFGTLADAGIQIPQEFSLGSILKLVLQILGLTYERIRGKAVKLIGERNISLIEKAWSIISTLLTGGPEALWEQIKEFLGNLKQMVVDSIQDWIVTTIVKSAITKLVSMFNPVGAIIQAIMTIYDVVMFLVGNINKILDFVQSIINSVHKIAVGDIDSAANWIEASLAKTIPLIISFLADLLNLGGLSEKIKNIIEKIQGTVDKAIDKVIEKIVKGIGKLFGKGENDTKETSETKGVETENFEESLSMNGASHALIVTEGPSPTVEMHSNKQDLLSNKIGTAVAYLMKQEPKPEAQISELKDEGGIGKKAKDLQKFAQQNRTDPRKKLNQIPGFKSKFDELKVAIQNYGKRYHTTDIEQFLTASTTPTKEEEFKALVDKATHVTPMAYGKHWVGNTEDKRREASRRGNGQFLAKMTAEDVKRLERETLLTGELMREGGGTYHVYKKFSEKIGYSNGENAYWLRAELTAGGFIHSHPRISKR